MRSERGAITIHVAIALIPLLMFLGIVIDQGSFYVARRQAQNAADAGALAGAIELMNFGTNSTATSAAQQFTAQLGIWGETTALADIQVSPLPFNCPDGVPSCIRVDVERGQPDRAGGAHSNTFPTFLVRMFGPANQGVRATATAQIAAGNAVQCIKPWVVADKWTDNTTGAAGGLLPGEWDQMDTFNPAEDVYTFPSSGFQATGPSNHVGYELVLKEGQNGVWSSGWTMEIDLGAHGSNTMRDEIEGCPNWVPTVGLYDPSVPCSNGDPPNPEEGCLSVKTGMSAGPTSQGVHLLIDRDQNATWDEINKTVTNTCMTGATCLDENGAPVSISPRIVPLAIFDTAAYADAPCNGSNCVARVRNLLGFFVEGMCDEVYDARGLPTPPYCGTNAEAKKMVIGRLMLYPGQGNGASGSAGPSTFLRMVRLIR